MIKQAPARLPYGLRTMSMICPATYETIRRRAPILLQPIDPRLYDPRLPGQNPLLPGQNPLLPGQNPLLPGQNPRVPLGDVPPPAPPKPSKRKSQVRIPDPRVIVSPLNL